MREKNSTAEEQGRALQYLKTHSVWSGIAPQALEEAVARHGTVECYEKGERIWGGEIGYRQALMLVLEGSAQVKKEQLLLSVHRQGDYFGLATLYSSAGFYAAEIEALGRCRVLSIPKEAIDALLDAHPQ
ncbi:MAG: cyclic nucleotide-binding domain-containing protein, partial [Oscillospiraceae bacterium]|nr:cyclic nucleotide-binding domain-containing protein [Oscillospiraceae bacterium]